MIYSLAMRHRRVGRGWSYAKTGWLGWETYLTSPFEEARMHAFLAGYSSEVYAASRIHVEDSEFALEIGRFKTRARTYFFAEETLRDAFVAMLNAIPIRSCTILLQEMPKKIGLHFRKKNWMLFKGEHGCFLSAEQISPEFTVYLKLRYG